jgi:hypothetical protein
VLFAANVATRNGSEVFVGYSDKMQAESSAFEVAVLSVCVLFCAHEIR